MSYHMLNQPQRREVDAIVLERRRGPRFIVETMEGERVLAELATALWSRGYDVQPGSRVRVQHDHSSAQPARILAHYGQGPSGGSDEG